ncbi:MAG: DUF393 domain-containing protein [Actinomycetota bacterium]|nr:DUF393 domain-containing protein [Actinomycetota bacterium]
MGEPILVFDGDCGFCTASARWIERRLTDGGARVRPWQELDLAALGLTLDDVTEQAWWIADGEPPRGGHEAIASALSAARRGWPIAGRALTAPGVDRLAARGYRLVARNRHRLPGATAACAIGNEDVGRP